MKKQPEEFNCHSIPQQEQRQDATNDQLRELLIAGNKLGLYDAVDVVQRHLINSGKR